LGEEYILFPTFFFVAADGRVGLQSIILWLFMWD